MQYGRVNTDKLSFTKRMQYHKDIHKNTMEYNRVNKKTVSQNKQNKIGEN
jgi:hypothetical protein